MSILNGKIEQLLSLAVATVAAGVMPAPMEHDPDRDAALRSLAAVAGQQGWSMEALRAFAGPQADLLFPGGEAELLEAWSDLCDRDMADAMCETDEPRLSGRVRAALLYRLPADEGRRTAAAKGMSLLLTPQGQVVFRRAWMRSVNALWQAAQDDSAGVAYVTKRLTLGNIYALSFLYWLARGQDAAAMAAFVDRQLALVLRFGRFRAKLAAGRSAAPAGAAAL
ncbi:ubiquinone biosynthesis protein COQ9 [Acetobacter vaccinii]|uniref:RpsU-divergently transcribed protein n=1 Tax=Acetobacter vaccinii TaxID=2592655 RepID=A0A5C1YQM7_9PROT|nr:rpsU-divergently transcribed protein [Acetobacter vaccinii]QEO18033.1 rpsU-divergently transcribed protein [Acetobacter vaccinii]